MIRALGQRSSARTFSDVFGCFRTFFGSFSDVFGCFRTCSDVFRTLLDVFRSFFGYFRTFADGFWLSSVRLLAIVRTAFSYRPSTPTGPYPFFKSFFCGRDSGRKKMQETCDNERRKKAFFCGRDSGRKKMQETCDNERPNHPTE